MIQILGAVLFSIVAVFTLFLALGLPLGEFSMGGKHKVIPPKTRILCWISLVIQIFAAVMILQAGNILPLWFPPKETRYIVFVFAIYLSFNTIINSISPSKKERYYMTPLSAIAAICFWITALKG